MYKLNDEKMFFDIAEGQAVVINYTTGMYYGTSDLGSLVLEALVNCIDEKKVLETIKKDSDCPADFEGKFTSFIGQLLDKEILVKIDNGNNDKEFILKNKVEDYSLTLDEYAEVQDLLLADPVHDVSADMGWPIMKEEDK